jgi:hypothetical protein
MEDHNFTISEFTVAPQVSPADKGLPYHEWFIEFESRPDDITVIEATLDGHMQQQNSYYYDLITGKILRPLQIKILEKDSFNLFMKQQGKLGGQNKIPRLSNDRKIADVLHELQP